MIMSLGWWWMAVCTSVFSIAWRTLLFLVHFCATLMKTSSYLPLSIRAWSRTSYRVEIISSVARWSLRHLPSTFPRDWRRTHRDKRVRKNRQMRDVNVTSFHSCWRAVEHIPEFLSSGGNISFLFFNTCPPDEQEFVWWVQRTLPRAWYSFLRDLSSSS